MHLVSATAPDPSMAGSAQFVLPRYPAGSRTDVHRKPIAPTPIVRQRITTALLRMEPIHGGQSRQMLVVLIVLVGVSGPWS
jgi:hypothetical protein